MNKLIDLFSIFLVVFAARMDGKEWALVVKLLKRLRDRRVLVELTHTQHSYLFVMFRFADLREEKHRCPICETPDISIIMASGQFENAANKSKASLNFEYCSSCADVYLSGFTKKHSFSERRSSCVRYRFVLGEWLKRYWPNHLIASDLQGRSSLCVFKRIERSWIDAVWNIAPPSVVLRARHHATLTSYVKEVLKEDIRCFLPLVWALAYVFISSLMLHLTEINAKATKGLMSFFCLSTIFVLYTTCAHSTSFLDGPSAGMSMGVGASALYLLHFAMCAQIWIEEFSRIIP
jgi:hypothetical protein